MVHEKGGDLHGLLKVLETFPVLPETVPVLLSRLLCGSSREKMGRAHSYRSFHFNGVDFPDFKDCENGGGRVKPGLRPLQEHPCRRGLVRLS